MRQTRCSTFGNRAHVCRQCAVTVRADLAVKVADKCSVVYVKAQLCHSTFTAQETDAGFLGETNICNICLVIATDRLVVDFR